MEQPDFEELAKKAGLSLYTSHDKAVAFRSFVDGCQRVWDDCVVTLQLENGRLAKQVKDLKEELKEERQPKGMWDMGLTPDEL